MVDNELGMDWQGPKVHSKFENQCLIDSEDKGKITAIGEVII